MLPLVARASSAMKMKKTIKSFVKTPERNLKLSGMNFSSIKAKGEIINKKEIIEAFEKMGRPSRPMLKRAVKLSSKFLEQKVRFNAPKGETKELSKGLTIIDENIKKNRKFKVGNQVVFDRAKNNIFQKMSKDQLNASKRYSGNAAQRLHLKQKGIAKTHAYYPSSVEFGYHHYYWGNDYANRKPVGGYRKGQYFIKNTAEQNYRTVNQLLGNRILYELDKKWRSKK